MRAYFQYNDPISHLTLDPLPSPLSIDTEWAEYLVGLKVNVPSNWWPEFDEKDLNPGANAAVDFSQTNQRYFQLLLDTDAEEEEV